MSKLRLTPSVDPFGDATLAAASETSLPCRGAAATGVAAPLPEVLPGAASWIAVPLATRDGIVGFVLAASGDPDRYTDAHVDIVATLAGQGAVAYDNAVLFDRVRELATMDGLTGVYNRRHVLELAEREFAAAAAAGHDLAAVMIDIDHFKRINDEHGHIVGDQVIREVAGRLQSALRPDDLLGRYGGEEFVLVLSAPRARANELAERVRTAVNGSPVRTDSGRLAATVSVGVAYLRPSDRELGALLGRADRALYVAKEEGRDRVAAA